MLVICICGPSGSGKSYITQRLTNVLGDEVTVLPEDAYYKDRSYLTIPERLCFNFDVPESLDHDLLIEHLRNLKAGRAIDLPIYEISTCKRIEETRIIYPAKYIIIEGIFTFTNANLRQLCDVLVYVDASKDICLLRRTQRDKVERSLSVTYTMFQYPAHIKPAYLKFIRSNRNMAHVIITNNTNNELDITEALDVIKSKELNNQLPTSTIVSGVLYLISGPPGVGKTAINHGVMEKMDYLHTLFLEGSEVRSHEAVDNDVPCALILAIQQKLVKGDDVMLDVDFELAKNIAEKFITAVKIYILPKSIAQLESQLSTERLPDIELKLKMEEAKAMISMKQYANYDYIIINRPGELKQSIKQIKGIICSGRLKARRQMAALSFQRDLADSALEAAISPPIF